MRLRNRTASVLLCLALIGAGTPAFAEEALPDPAIAAEAETAPETIEPPRAEVSDRATAPAAALPTTPSTVQRSTAPGDTALRTAGSVALSQDVDLRSDWNLTGDVVLDLAGQSLTARRIHISGHSLTIRDSGTDGTLAVEADEDIGIDATGGTLRIEGGTVTASHTLEETGSIAIGGADAQIVLVGGTLRASNNGPSSTAIGGPASRITVADGTLDATNAGWGGVAIGGANARITVAGGHISTSTADAGVGIGGDRSTVTVSGGDVTATAAALGTAIGGEGAEVTITGGRTAGTGSGRPAIGGSASTIRIAGGDVTAQAGPSTSGIGGYRASVSIDDGQVSAEGGLASLGGHGVGALAASVVIGPRAAVTLSGDDTVFYADQTVVHGSMTVTSGALSTGRNVGEITISETGVVEFVGAAATTANITGLSLQNDGVILGGIVEEHAEVRGNHFVLTWDGEDPTVVLAPTLSAGRLDLPDAPTTGLDFMRFIGWFTHDGRTSLGADTPLAGFGLSEGAATEIDVHSLWVHEVLDLELAYTGTARQGETVTLTAIGIAGDGQRLGDATDEITFESSVDTAVIDGNRLTFTDASPHVITATHANGATATLLIEVEPRADEEVSETGTIDEDETGVSDASTEADASSTPSGSLAATGGAVPMGLVALGALAALLGLVLLVARRRLT